MVFELLSSSIFDFLKENNFKSFPQRHIQAFARQLFKSIHFLHGLTLVHTDLKPENILLVNSDWRGKFKKEDSGRSKRARTSDSPSKGSRILYQSDIRLIDFGSAIFDSEYHPSIVSTRHYRAPEVVLGLGWSYSCDIWSIGCILTEFLTGEALFQTHDNLEHLAMMERILGPIPGDMIKKTISKGLPAYKYFSYHMVGPSLPAPTLSNQPSDYSSFPSLSPASSTNQNWEFSLMYPSHETSRQSLRFVQTLNPLNRIFLAKTHHVQSTSGSQTDGPVKSEYLIHFLDLVRQCLQYDPDERISARKALDHPFFNVVSYDDE